MPVIKDVAKERYRNIAQLPDLELAGAEPYDISNLESFIPQEVLNVSQRSGLSLGLADVRAGEAVLIIGTGAGIDCFEAARRVGAEGKVVGIESADDLFSIARRNGPIVAKNLNIPASVIDFKKGIAEDLPLEHEQFDLVISNYQTNFSTDKHGVHEELFRVLRPGARFYITDIGSDTLVPEYIKGNEDRWGVCLSGSLDLETYLKSIRKAGFSGVEQLKFAYWKQIDGIHFCSVTLRGFKLSKVAASAGEPTRYAIFRGPFAKVKDELGNVYQRGQSKKISRDVFEILNLPGYRPYFILSNEAVDSTSIESQLICAMPSNEREFWNGDYAILTSLFLMGEDDDHHTFYAGQPVEISENTKEIFSGKYYSRFFTVLNRSSGKGE